MCHWSIHMLHADTQIVPTRNDRQDGSGPKAQEADLLDPVLGREGARENQCPKRHKLQSRFPFGQLRHGHGHAQFGKEFTQARHGNFRSRIIKAGIR